MRVITAPFGPVGLVSVIYIGFIFSTLSRRLGAVTKMPAYHRGFYLANLFLALALLSHVMYTSASLAPEQAPAVLAAPLFHLLAYHIPLTLGVTLDLVLVFYYWRWMLWEKAG